MQVLKLYHTNSTEIFYCQAEREPWRWWYDDNVKMKGASQQTLNAKTMPFKDYVPTVRCCQFALNSPSRLHSVVSQPAKLQKKQCGGVYFCVYGTAFSMPIEQKLPPPVLIFSDFAGWVWSETFSLRRVLKVDKSFLLLIVVVDNQY